jgi:hypothetical protein
MDMADGKLTPRQRRWLEHLLACKRERTTIREYAQRRGLAVQSLYQAASELRKRGLLADRETTRGPAERETRRPLPRFVELRPERPVTSMASWRARLPNGVILEGSGTVDGEFLAHLAAL